MNHPAAVLLGATLLLSHLSPAQTPLRRSLIYARIEGNAGTASGPHFGIAAIFKKSHELGLAGAMYLRPIQNKPPDFECGCINGIGYDGLSGVSATYAYLLYPGKSQGYWRIALRGGIIAGYSRRTHDFRPIPPAGPYEANYSWEETSGFGYGLVVRPTVDLAINRAFGFTAGPYAVWSRNFSGGGITFGVMLGRVGREGAHQRVEAWKKRVRGAGKDENSIE